MIIITTQLMILNLDDGRMVHIMDPIDQDKMNLMCKLLMKTKT